MKRSPSPWSIEQCSWVSYPLYLVAIRRPSGDPAAANPPFLTRCDDSGRGGDRGNSAVTYPCERGDEGAAPRRRGNLSNRDYSNEEGEEEEEGADDNSLDRIAVAKQF